MQPLCLSKWGKEVINRKLKEGLTGVFSISVWSHSVEGREAACDKWGSLCFRAYSDVFSFLVLSD